MPFNRVGWQYILDVYNGYLPIEIQAVPEGSIVPVGNVLVQVINTDPQCAWLTSYVETALLRAVWYPTTIATLSADCKKTIRKYLQETADNLDGLPYKLHDFGARGASSEESAAIGGVAHLVNFKGSDTVSAVLTAQRIYQEPMAAFSIPAAEHSTITCWGKEHETEAYANMLKQFGGKNKLLAVVSDSYDIWNAVDKIWGNDLKDQVINSGATVVVRPDSGDPVMIVTEVINRLMKQFGFRKNSKGYKVLPDFIRVIQGDGISPKIIAEILAAMRAQGQSADNIAFGMGAELLQKVNRDTMRFAMKASSAYINGQWVDVYKDPVTDKGKRSKRGRLALIKDETGMFKTIAQNDCFGKQNQLRTVFRNGKMTKRWRFSEIREHAQ